MTPPSRPPIPLGRRLVYATVVTVVALAALEGLAKLLPDRLTGRREIVLSNPGQGEAMVANEDVPGWDLNYPEGTLGPQRYTTNRWRMRGPDHPVEKPANAWRVIFVGDSAIFGYLLEWPETIAAGVEQLGESKHPGVDYQVAACAAPGHSSAQSVYKLSRHCLGFQPDVVVIGNRNSDGTMDVASDRERFQLQAWAGPASLLQRYALYRLIRNQWLGWRVASEAGSSPEPIAHGGAPGVPKGDVRRVPPDEYADNLREMIRLSRQADAQPVLLLLPIVYDLPGYGQQTAPQNLEYNQAMRQVASEESVPLADGQAWFATIPLVDGTFVDPVHPGRIGARFIADLVHQTLPAPDVETQALSRP